VYHFGARWPWITNDVPDPGKFEAIFAGGFNLCPTCRSFYRMFSGDGLGGGVTPAVSAGGKPFMVTETGSTFHVAYDGPPVSVPDVGEGRVAVKQAWWRQFLNATLLNKYPKLKAVCTFEFSKHEETTFRDFTNFGDTGTGAQSVFGNDCGPLDGPILAAFQEDIRTSEIDGLILWANSSSAASQNTGNTTVNGTNATNGNSSSPTKPSASNAHDHFGISLIYIGILFIVNLF
jgi:hypothetical protein